MQVLQKLEGVGLLDYSFSELQGDLSVGPSETGVILPDVSENGAAAHMDDASAVATAVLLHHGDSPGGQGGKEQGSQRQRRKPGSDGRPVADGEWVSSLMLDPRCIVTASLQQ